MKSLLLGLFNQLMLGKNLITKTLIQLLNELSHAFHFLLSSWQPAYSYGQTSTRAMHLFSSKHQFQLDSHAYQDLQATQHVSLRRKKRLKNKHHNNTSLREFELNQRSHRSAEQVWIPPLCLFCDRAEPHHC